MLSQGKTTILFLCTGNSCRSQMAEGFSRHLKGSQIKAYSAGVNPEGVDPWAVKAMADVGIDISQQGSKSLADIGHLEFDTSSLFATTPRKLAQPSRPKPESCTCDSMIHPDWPQVFTAKRKL